MFSDFCELDKIINVLYVHHAAPFGGASRSLFELLRAFPEGSVQPKILTKSGQFQSILESAGFEVIGGRGISQFDNTHYSYYRNFRWLVLARETIYLPLTFWGLLAARRRWGKMDLIHINDMTLTPVVWIAKKLFGCPIIVHVRSVQRRADNIRSKFLHLFIMKNVVQLIAIDETVKRSLSRDFNVAVVHNGLTVSDTMIAKVRQSPKETLIVGMVGGLSRVKGCIEFIEAAKICRDHGANIKFVFVGQSMRKPSPVRDFFLRLLGVSQEVYSEMKDRITTYQLESLIEFWPFTTELENIYSRLDILCFPSHLDAPGRPIFEAAFFGVPSIAAITNPTDDTILNNITGFTILPNSPAQLAECIMRLYKDPTKRREMGNNARNLAQENFDAKKNALQVLEIYQLCIRQNCCPR